MRFQMNEIQVEVREGEKICISQGSPGDDIQVIYISPEQVPFVCDWLKQCAAEYEESEDAAT